MELGAQATVNAEELLVHDSGERKGAEGLHAGLVHDLGVLVLALELEGEVISQVTTLVVSSQQPEGLGVVNLQTPQVEDTLYTEVATVDVITEEQVSGLSRVTANFEQLHEIVVLAVDVTTYGDGGVHLEKVWLGAQELCTLMNDPESLLLSETALAIEVLLEELDVGLGLSLVLEELVVGRLVHGGCLDIYEATASQLHEHQGRNGMAMEEEAALKNGPKHCRYVGESVKV